MHNEAEIVDRGQRSVYYPFNVKTIRKYVFLNIILLTICCCQPLQLAVMSVFRNSLNARVL